jgi:hypothetical protein
MARNVSDLLLGRAAAGLVASFVAWCAAGCVAGTRSVPQWQIAPVSASDRITVQQVDGCSTFDIESAKGIGSATVGLTAGTRPNEVWLCFHLHGLEELRFEYDSTLVVVSMSNTDPPRIRQQMERRGRPPQVLAAGDPCWLDWRVEITAGRAPTPPERIWMAAPADFLCGRAREFRLRWIDFHR